MASEPSLHLRCGRIFDPSGPGIAGPVEILVQGDTIAAVAPRIEPGAAPIVDLRECTMVAGLHDLDVPLLPGPVDDATGLWLYRAVARAGDLLRAGVTTARVLGGADPRWSLVDLRSALAAGLVAGPELLVAPHRVNGGAPLDGLAPLVARELRNGADWIAVDRPGMRQADLGALVGTANDVPVAVAATTTGELRSAVLAGARSVETSCAVDAPTARLVAARGAYLVPRSGFGAQTLAGVNVCFGGQLEGGLQNLAEMLGAAAALRAATETAAACLGRRDRGRIAVGQRADLVAVDGDPLVDPGRLDDVALVVRGGVAQR